MRRFALALCLMTISGTLTAADPVTPHEATHKQVRQIKPSHDGKPIALNTFCLDTAGNILACVGGDSSSYVASEDGTFETKVVASPKLLQKYSPEGELLLEVELEFKPTAVNQAPDGSVFVAGDGKVAHVSAEGKLLTTADSPHLGDIDALRKKAEKDAKEQLEMMTRSFGTQITRLEASLEKLKEKEEPTDRDQKRIKALESQLKVYTDQKTQMEESYSQFFSVDSMLSRAKTITSLGVNSKYVFLCCGSGRGYDVWRTTHEFSEPKAVAEGLGGCCGQCDIQVTEDNLVLAENTKFKVGLLSLDGERQNSFGSRDRSSAEGFGSCCNPMNVRCCSNGDILTAESSIGTIKRFNSEGEFVGTVGKAKIGGGCKHVALDFDEKRDRYYIQYEDKNAICVMLPLSEAPEFTESELLAKAAREGLARKLLGDGKNSSSQWTLDGKPVAAAKQKGVLSSFVAALTSDDSEEDAPAAAVYDASDSRIRSFKFHANGKLELAGGMFAQGENSWEAVSQDEEAKTLVFAHLQDGVQYYDYRVEFLDDDTAKFTMLYGGSAMSSDTYKRVPVQKEEKEVASK